MFSFVRVSRVHQQTDATESLQCELSVEQNPERTRALPDETTQSFIVKVWLEETAKEKGNARWRGHITHVPSNRRAYIEKLDQICIFVAPYLEAMKVRLGYRWRLWQWLFRAHR